MGKLKIILAVINAVTSLKAPPSPENEAELRSWIVGVIDLLKILANYVPGDVDDKIIALLGTAVADDGVWASFYALFRSEAEGKLMATHDDCPTVSSAAAVNPVVVFEFITLLVQLWKAWNK